MKNLTCKNCGGPMLPDASGLTAACRYCGTKYALNHEDTDYYLSFYKRMNGCFADSADDAARRRRADELWEDADTQTFACADGSEIEINHMYSYAVRGAEVYVARKNVLYRFLSDGEALAERTRRAVAALQYPGADMRGLAQFFPKISGGFPLADGSFLLALTKDPDEYPLCLFGRLSGRHAAWVISRLENLCCVLEYSGLVHPAVDAANIYVNPYMHTASLYGGWWLAAKHNAVSSETGAPLKLRQNLTGLRDTAAGLLGYEKAGRVPATGEIPKPLADFINSMPKATAYDDFAYWDEMLIKSYGERKFIKMETDDEAVYKG